MKRFYYSIIICLLSTYAFAGEYCTPPKYRTGPFTGITSCNIGNMKHLSRSDIGYADYTASADTILANTQDSLEMELTVYYSPNMTSFFSGKVNVRVWVDWNQDYDFTDQGEEVVAETVDCTENPMATIVTLTFSIPRDAKGGFTRVRVYEDMLPSDGHNIPAPCGYDDGLGQHGEVEDYMLLLNGVSSIDENVSTNDVIRLYPNPAQNTLHIEGLQDGVAKAAIVNAQGLSFPVRISSGKEINLQSFDAGLYFLVVEQEGQYTMRKFIIE